MTTLDDHVKRVEESRDILSQLEKNFGPRSNSLPESVFYEAYVAFREAYLTGRRSQESSSLQERLQALWRSLRDGADPESMAYVRGVINGAAVTGGLPSEGEELWMLRIERCPGHDDEGGRSWCAYCGIMKEEIDEEV